MDDENKHLRVSFLGQPALKTKVLYCALSVLTLGVLPLLASWFSAIRLWIYPEVNSPDEAAFALLTNTKTRKKSIKKLTRKQVTLFPHYAPRELTFFYYKKHFYYLSLKSTFIKSLKGKFLEMLKKDKSLLERHLNGISTKTAAKLLQVYKDNVIDIRVESIPRLTLKLLITPFSMFQIFALILWYLDDYLSYALLILVMMVGAIATDVYEIRSEAFKIRELAHHEVLVDISRVFEIGSPLESRQPRVVTREKLKETKGNAEPLSGSDEPLLDDSDADLKSAGTRHAGHKVEKRLVSSFNITIGDIVDIQMNELVPADVVLVSGKCLIDESTLTGETVPVLKTAVEPGAAITEMNTLASGTRCLNTFGARGLVVATGYYSKKGELVRSLLLTDPIEFKFQTDALRFVVLTIIISTVGFFWFVFYIGLGVYSEYYTWQKIVIKGLEIFTVAVPPALPLCLAIGNAIANRRLQQQNVFTRVLGKINEAGRVACACFDKTGTLTENRLILYGILPIYDGEEDLPSNPVRESEAEEIDEEGGKYLLFDSRMDGPIDLIYQRHKIRDRSYFRAMIETMGTCHSLALFHSKPVGDPMEEQLFQFSEFKMEERLDTSGEGKVAEYATFVTPSAEFIKACEINPNFEFKVVKRIDFSSERKRMSVLLSNNQNKLLTFICKGAPEIIKELCDPTSLPFNFDEVLEEYTEQGLRVIAVANSRYPGLETVKDKTAAELESKMQFIGFLLFQNPLKPKTAETIQQLKECKISCKMITGDNLLTATSVGIATGIVNRSAALFACHCEDGEVWWEHLENEDEKQQKHTSIFAADHSGIYLSRKSSISVSDSESIDEQEQSAQKKMIQAYCDKRNCSIVMTGEAFDKLYSGDWEKDKFLNSVLESAVVFARTSPEQKAAIVSKIQTWYKNRSSDNWFVAFCGDGANDCSALKKADVGLSLSEAEASIAAPFNTTTTDISSILPLFREGKASLETAFMNFKYILYYSFVQFIALIYAYDHAQEFANGHYYFMDLVVFLPLSIFLCSNGTIERLNKHFPRSSLMKPEVLFEIFGHIGLVGIAYFIFNWLLVANPETLNPDEVALSKDIDAEAGFNILVFAYFVMASALYAVGALVFNRGYPFKVDPWRNFPLVFYATVSLIATALILFAAIILPDGALLYWFDRAFRELRFDHNAIFTIAAVTILTSLACYAFENTVVPRFKEYLKAKHKASEKRRRDKAYNTAGN